jgi:hypothetical protein
VALSRLIRSDYLISAVPRNRTVVSPAISEHVPNGQLSSSPTRSSE